MNSIYLRWWEVRDSVPQDCCIPSLEQDSQAPPQVVDSLTLILASVPGKGWSKLLDFPLSYSVPTTKSLSMNVAPEWCQVVLIYVSMWSRDVLSGEMPVPLILLQWQECHFILCCHFVIKCSNISIMCFQPLLVLNKQKSTSFLRKWLTTTFWLVLIHVRYDLLCIWVGYYTLYPKERLISSHTL